MSDYEQQQKDSDMIFTQISTSGLENMDEAKRFMMQFYIPDMSISRAGISHAIKRLERFYKDE